MLLGFLFGDDLFISYSRRDGTTYSARLANELSEPELPKPRRELSCFLDAWGASPADDLSPLVLRALARSRALVLVGTPGVATSSMVPQEITRFSERRSWSGHRPMLLINVGGGLDHVTWPELAGLPRIPEPSLDFPSPSTVRLIRDSYSFLTRHQRTRLISMAAMAFLLLSAGAGFYAIDRAREAVKQELQARASTHRAEEEQRKAQEATASASASAKRAVEQEGLALANARQAERQARLAVARQLSARAALLVQEGNHLPEGVRTAIRAMQVETSDSTTEAYQALRSGLALLPRAVSHMGYGQSIRRFGLSGDGRYLATADARSVVRLWDTARARVVASRTYGSGAFLTGLALSPDASLVAVGFGGTLEVLRVPNAPAKTDAEGGALTLDVRLPLRQPESPTFSPNGELLAAVGYGGGVTRVWTVGNWQEVAEAHGGANGTGFAAEGTLLVVASHDAVQTTVLGRDRLARPAAIPTPLAGMVAFAVNGSHMAAADATSVRVWSWIPTSREWRAYSTLTHQGRIRALAISTDGALVCAGSDDGTARVWSLADQREVLRLTHGAGVTGAAFTRDGRNVVTVGEDQVARLWETATDATTLRLAHPADVRALVFGEGGQTMWTAAGDGQVRRWRAGAEGRVEALSAGPAMSDGEIPYEVLAAAFDPSGTHASVAVSAGTVFVWHLATGESEQFDVSFEATALAVAPRGDVAVAGGSGDRDGDAVEIWATTGTPTRRSRFTLTGVRALAFTRDGRYLAAAGEGGIVVWDVLQAHAERKLEGAGVMAVSFSADGRRLALADDRNRVSVWTWGRTGDRPAPVTASEGRVRAIAFSTEGRHLAFAATGRVTPIWDLVRHREVARLSHEAEVTALTFSPDGRHLGTACGDRTARVSLWPPDDLIAEANRRLSGAAARE